MSRVVLAAALVTWAGAALVLSEVRWFRQVPLTDRLGHHTRGGLRAGRRPRPAPTAISLAATAATSVGSRIGRVLGLDEDLERRLRRIHADVDVAGYRIRQLAGAVAAFGLGVGVIGAGRPPLPVSVLVVVAGPLLVWLIAEQRVVSASQRWQRRVVLELPIVAEQMATLVNAGWSLLGALDRVASRGHGACATDLRRVVSRVGQGLSQADALAEWAHIVDVDHVERLVAVLALDHQTTDLGRLLSAEARSVRRDVHRELVEAMERRAQQVWIPVTVATLLPGVVFIAIPFVTALRSFVDV